MSRILDEVGLNNTPSQTYNISNIPKADIIGMNSELCKSFGLTLTEKQKNLSILYLLPKMHKNPVGCRFIIASKDCSTKPITQAMEVIK